MDEETFVTGFMSDPENVRRHPDRKLRAVAAYRSLRKERPELVIRAHLAAAHRETVGMLWDRVVERVNAAAAAR